MLELLSCFRNLWCNLWSLLYISHENYLYWWNWKDMILPLNYYQCKQITFYDSCAHVPCTWIEEGFGWMRGLVMSSDFVFISATAKSWTKKNLPKYFSDVFILECIIYYKLLYLLIALSQMKGMSYLTCDIVEIYSENHACVFLMNYWEQIPVCFNCNCPLVINIHKQTHNLH